MQLIILRGQPYPEKNQTRGGGELYFYNLNAWRLADSAGSIRLIDSWVQSSSFEKQNGPRSPLNAFPMLLEIRNYIKLISTQINCNIKPMSHLVET